MATDTSDYGDHGDWLILVAIDFGTAFSGYGFTFQGSKDIIMNKDWTNRSGYIIQSGHFINHKIGFLRIISRCQNIS